MYVCHDSIMTNINDHLCDACFNKMCCKHECTYSKKCTLWHQAQFKYKNNTIIANYSNSVLASTLMFKITKKQCIR